MVVKEMRRLAKLDNTTPLDVERTSTSWLGCRAPPEYAGAKEGGTTRDMDRTAACGVAANKGCGLHAEHTSTHLQCAAIAGAAARERAVFDLKLSAIDNHLTVQHQATKMDLWRTCTGPKQRRAYGLL